MQDFNRLILASALVLGLSLIGCEAIDDNVVGESRSASESSCLEDCRAAGGGDKCVERCAAEQASGSADNGASEEVRFCIEQCVDKGDSPDECREICGDRKEDDGKWGDKDDGIDDEAARWGCYKECLKDKGAKGAALCKEYCFDEDDGDKDDGKKDVKDVKACFDKCVAQKGKQAAEACKKMCSGESKGDNGGDKAKDPVEACFDKCVAAKGKEAAAACKEYCVNQAKSDGKSDGKAGDKAGDSKDGDQAKTCFDSCKKAGGDDATCKKKCAP